MSKKPPTDLKSVLQNEIKEWHFHIYFHQGNAEEQHYALELRDAVLRLRRDGAFIAVPLFRVNTDPIGPHPAGKHDVQLERVENLNPAGSCSYEVWAPSETFASLFSYLALHRGPLSILVHPLTREEVSVYPALESRSQFSPGSSRKISPAHATDVAIDPPSVLTDDCRDHQIRSAWIGPSWPLDLSKLPVRSETIPLQYPSLKVGYSSNVPFMNLEDRAILGANVEKMLLKEKDAARAPVP
ncbi:unnamed protein product [Mycena citricolor]|uniref:DOPA 4,5-dioxygenase n=1 Tax=Mycena citricolor TaxID=2018698 RepID=A0AAD2HRU7_9AGAR|nr:unnamed protein product [Mycena citricolor]CAK5281046.1 unnamed protein product [Mycena citricolor]